MCVLSSWWWSFSHFAIFFAIEAHTMACVSSGQFRFLLLLSPATWTTCCLATLPCPLLSLGHCLWPFYSFWTCYRREKKIQSCRMMKWPVPLGADCLNDRSVVVVIHHLSCPFVFAFLSLLEGFAEAPRFDRFSVRGYDCLLFPFFYCVIIMTTVHY